MKPIPSIVELQQKITEDFKSKLNLSDDDLKKTLNAFSLVLSGQMKILYLFLADIQNNIFADSADSVDQG